MTKLSPRIYTYKITFDEVPYYYYGVHKEKRYNEYYMGSSVTHKWCWNFYTPKKQILEFFEFSDEGWIEAQKVEKRLIRPFYNTDKWCLNESCGGKSSALILKRNQELGIGIHSLSTEKRIEVARSGGQKCFEFGLGAHSLTYEEKREIGKRSGNYAYENKLGFHKWAIDEKIKHNKNAGKRAYELGTGIHSQTHEEKIKMGMITYEMRVGVHALTSEEKSEFGKKGGITTSSQVWECTVTGYQTNAGALSRYQRKRNIDTSNRIRIK
jgi:general stress protein YciG